MEFSLTGNSTYRRCGKQSYRVVEYVLSDNCSKAGIKMDSPNKQSHLTIEERRIILSGITNGATKSSIAKTIGKDNSTVGKEIKLHRILSHKCNMPLECNNYRGCPHGRNCTPDCPDYSAFTCSRRDRSPGACNGCSQWSRCRFNKFTYDPEKAQAEYREVLVDSRTGVNLTTSEAKAIADRIAPLLKQGLSPYQILQIYPDLGICEKTIYNYLEEDVFHEVSGLTVMELRRQVGRKISKKRSNEYKKRQDRKYLIGRTYKDFKAYLNDNPGVFFTEMDTVYNDVSNGPFLQTFKFRHCGVLFGLLHQEKTAQAMASGVDSLEQILTPPVFRKHVNALLTDRGSEFSAAERMETASDGSVRTRVFYCDPMQSGQKGSLENNHIELRYILPKETDLTNLGLTDQTALNLVLSHINSAPVESFGGKSPLELAEFLYPDLFAQLVAFGIRKIDKDEIILKPYLLKLSDK